MESLLSVTGHHAGSSAHLAGGIGEAVGSGDEPECKRIATMLQTSTLLVASAAFLTSLASAEPLPKLSINFRDLPHVEQRGIHNIHIDYTGAVDGELTLAYGQCDTATLVDAHHLIGTTRREADRRVFSNRDEEAQSPAPEQEGICGCR